MPAQPKGPRLWLRPTRRGRKGQIVREARWLIRDGDIQESTGCGIDDRRGAEQALVNYLNRKHIAEAAKKVSRDPQDIPIADVLILYLKDVAPSHTRPGDTVGRFRRLIEFFGDRPLSDINGALCRKFAATKSNPSAARRELEDLRAAINHHRREGHCSHIVEVVLPPRHVPRERWLTRTEVARLIWAAWRYREVQQGAPTDRPSLKHLARFVLLALYTGTRASAVCEAALQQTPGKAWVDLERGIFYRKPPSRRETKKRQPPVPLPYKLLAHLRRWKQLGQKYVVEWNGRPVQSVDKAFAHAVRIAGLEGPVSPHTLRHTAATWLMQAGTDAWEAAGYLGMSVEMIQGRYGHHHPDYLQRARMAFDRHRATASPTKRGNRTETNANER